MNVLAFDTCLGAVSAAVRWKSGDGAWQQHEIFEQMETGQAERLMPMIAEVMSASGLGFADLQRIAVTHGPGTFTGVRIGVAAARALALSTGCPVVVATSLRVMALGALSELKPLRQGVLVVALDARRGGLYLQSFAAGTGAELSRPEVLSPEEAAQRLDGTDTVAVGSGAEILAQAADGRIEVRLPGLLPHAGDLALLAPKLTPVSPVMPLYLRPPDAKPQTGAALPRAD